MFKIYLRLLTFVRPIGKYAVPYFIYSILHALFNTVNYIMLIPIIQAMFDPEFRFEPLYVRPEFAFDEASLSAWLRYAYTSVFGEYNPMYVLILLATVTVLMNLLSNTFRYLGAWTVENMRTRTLQRMRNELFDNVINLNVGFFSEQRKGDIMSRITQDVMVVQFCITNTLQVAFREPFLIIGYLVAMFSISWELSVFSILFLPLVALIIGNIVKKLRHPAMQSQQRMGDMVSVLDESLSGVKLIKGYNATNYIRQKFYDINAEFSRLLLSMARRQQLASPMSEFLGISAVGVILVFGGMLVINRSLNAGEFVAFIAMFSQTRPVRSFIDQFANINQGVAAGERILMLLDTKTEVPDAPDARTLDGLHEGIEFRNVRFSYDGNREVIDGVSFTLHEGEVVGLAGLVGSGRTEVLRAIFAADKLYRGKVVLEGNELSLSSSIDAIRHGIGLLPEERKRQGIVNCLSVKDNITMLYSQLHAKCGFLRKADDDAIVRHYIDELHIKTPSAMQAVGNLSGGNQQKAIVAREIDRDPKLLIAVQPTRGLDVGAIEYIHKKIVEQRDAGKAVLLVSLELDEVMDVSDRILVMYEGEIVGELDPKKTTVQELGLYMAGAKRDNSENNKEDEQ